MTPEVLNQAQAAGVTLWAEGDALRYRGPREVIAKLLPELKARKIDILAALAHPDDIALWWRVTITEPGARTVEIDTPSGWTLADWQAYAEHYHGRGCAVTAVLPLPKPRAPVNLDEAIRAACDGVAAITPAQFRSLPSPEDVADIEASAVHSKSLHAYALSFAEGIRSGRLVSAARAKP